MAKKTLMEYKSRSKKTEAIDRLENIINKIEKVQNELSVDSTRLVRPQCEEITKLIKAIPDDKETSQTEGYIKDPVVVLADGEIPDYVMPVTHYLNAVEYCDAAKFMQVYYCDTLLDYLYNRKIENISNPGLALTLPLIVGFSFSAVSSLMAGMFWVTVDVSFEVAYKTAEAYMSKTFKLGMIVSTLIGVGLGAFNYIKKKKAEKDFKELKQLIGEGMLEKQWNLEDFQKMAKDDSESKKFLEQLLVLEPSSSENNEKNTPLLDKNKLNEKVEAFKELFAKEPETLKNVNDNYKKEIYKE